jgi:hypothetical protein
VPEVWFRPFLIGDALAGRRLRSQDPVNRLEKQSSDIEPAEHLNEVV